MLLSSAEVNNSASKAYSEVIADAKNKNLLDRNPAVYRRVRNISNRLVSKVAVFRADAPGWKWETHVLTSRDVTAWCMPGGQMAVYTGLFEQLKITDDELAAVMGHEIAHALREHGREKASQAAGISTATAIGAKLFGSRTGLGEKATQNALNKVADLAFMRPNSREMEQESDRIGIELAARAGYNPQAAITLWEKMAKVSGDAGPEWLSTHPSNTSRIADLKVYAERVAPLYAEARKGKARGRTKAK
jgi:predicted Zn-dependent protease